MKILEAAHREMPKTLQGFHYPLPMMGHHYPAWLVLSRWIYPKQQGNICLWYPLSPVNALPKCVMLSRMVDIRNGNVPTMPHLPALWDLCMSNALGLVLLGAFTWGDTELRRSHPAYRMEVQCTGSNDVGWTCWKIADTCGNISESFTDICYPLVVDSTSGHFEILVHM